MQPEPAGKGNLFHCFVALCREGLREGTVLLLSGLWRFAWEEAASWHLWCCQSLHILPVCHFCPFSCCLGSEFQRGWVCISPEIFLDPLRGVSWLSCSFFHQPTPTGFYSKKLWGLIFVTLDPWAGWSGLVLGLLTPKVSLMIFIHHAWMWDSPFHCLSAFLPHPSGWMWLF